MLTPRQKESLTKFGYDTWMGNIDQRMHDFVWTRIKLEANEEDMDEIRDCIAQGRSQAEVDK